MRKSEREVSESSRIITRRVLMLGAIQAAVVSVLGLKLRSMQIEHADQYRMLSDGNSIKIRLLPPARGLILDRNGTIIAGNEQNYRVTLTREEAGDVSAVIARLRQIIPMTDRRAAELLEEIRKRSAVTPVMVADRLTWAEFSSIALNAPALPGVTPEAGLSRSYPRAGDFAHVLGYVGPVSDYDLSKIENPDPVLRLPEFQLGKVGMEAKLEEVLRGKAGARRVEVNSAGREMRELSRQEGQQGATVQTTLDAGLQNFATQRLGEESAAAVVIDVTNGDIVAISSSPVFDPNKFVRGISGPDYRALMNHDHRPLADKTVQGAYPPGSTFKMVTLLAGLEAGVINPGSRFYCPGSLQVAGRRFHCWSRGGHGTVNAIQSLEQSCDVFYYELAQRVGIDRIAAMARKLGIGVRHDLPMSAITEGIAPDRAWKRAKYNQEWQLGDSINASIGQGYVLASPLQLAIMTARIATGRAVQPRLVRAIDGVTQPVPEWPDLDINPLNLRTARAGMDAVMNGSHGTARRSRILAPEWQMAGKTGTSQVRNITAAERARGVISNDQLPWNRRDHALFVCYAPYEMPRYAVSVVVEHGGGGSTAAAPIARDILLYALAGGLPPITAYPDSERAKVQEMWSRMNLAPSTPQSTERAKA
ncbi:MULTISPECIES: penicillin-binding protein 2 [unclassified Paracoccus (in: a-proteobacteria)]|uniref:penicillin-binding protein 2 n=1 Tax=unclassified Paracoccus (in: a-proteobacteria) TaxID=2688777 RepID=UPI0012B30839|nr:MULTISPECIES: penicillin-binding protein 2 [unclassified Paracoccus (in: a-proteobacteria)]UXU74266.1 penicillin-binding protein 2 [Paracoccus sp. SMMA_5]UXU80157.1 penicillin-binding protein 2 [Paracoccus sp. SMMA_5_TC]